MSRSVRFPGFVWHALTEPSSDHSTLKAFGRIPSVTVGTQAKPPSAAVCTSICSTVRDAAVGDPAVACDASIGDTRQAGAALAAVSVADAREDRGTHSDARSSTLAHRRWWRTKTLEPASAAALGTLWADLAFPATPPALASARLSERHTLPSGGTATVAGAVAGAARGGRIGQVGARRTSRNEKHDHENAHVTEWPTGKRFVTRRTCGHHQGHSPSIGYGGKRASRPSTLKRVSRLERFPHFACHASPRVSVAVVSQPGKHPMTGVCALEPPGCRIYRRDR